MSGGEERYPYRYPVWLGFIAFLMLYLIGVPDLTAPTVPPVWPWYLGTGLVLLLGAGMLLSLVATVASHVRRCDVVLTDHGVTFTAPLRRTVSIDFAAVERLDARTVVTPGGQRHGYLTVRAPSGKAAIWSKALGSGETFDNVVETVAKRVAAHGGPGLND